MPIGDQVDSSADRHVPAPSGTPVWLQGDEPLMLGRSVSPLPESVRAATDQDLEPLVELVVERCSTLVFASHLHDREFKKGLRASVRENVYALRDVIDGRVKLDGVRLASVLSLPKMQAQLRIPQKLMQSSYRLSFYVQWEAWTAILREHMDRAGISGQEATDAMIQLTKIIMNYHDHIASQVADIYTRDYEELNRSRSHVRNNLIRDVLRGQEAHLSASDAALLAYPFDGHHVAVLLPELSEAAASRLALSIRSAAKANYLLVHPLSLSSTVIWFCRLDPWHSSGLEALRRVLEKHGSVAAISAPGRGMEGFRRCMTQAGQAQDIRLAWGEGAAETVISYADVDLEILLTQNSELARSFVETELGPIAENTVEAARLRATLAASFRFGSHVATAKHLQLHEHTVRNRLQRAEELLGSAFQQRRTELQVALRLLPLLGDADEGLKP